jgi:aspartate racemase
MKTMGLIGGTGWISTVEYYRIMNETINKRLGKLNSAKCIIFSFNYGEIDALNKRNDMAGVLALLKDAAGKLEAAGAEGIMLCANTLHMFADDLGKSISLPIVHIAEAAAKKIKEKNMSTVGLLGTKYTMNEDFYKQKLKEKNIETLVPDADERDFIHNAIMKELLKGIFNDQTKAAFLDIIRKLESRGAEGIVLGCTEIPLIIKQEDTFMPIFDTTVLHALAGVDFVLNS